MNGPQDGRAALARGIGPAALARAGALIEVVAQPAYVWMFGLAGYGLYVVLWSAVNILAHIINLAMGQALQRVVPADAGGRGELAHAAVRLALLWTVVPGVIAAVLIVLFAEPLAALVSVAPEQRAGLPDIIRLFAWSLPLWITLEVATAAARARQAFGPEIRLRIFWEQASRLGFAVMLFLAGSGVIGLFAAHVLSLAVTAVLALRLLTRYFDPGLLRGAPSSAALRRDLFLSGLAFMPPMLTRRAMNDLPPVILNLLLPGGAGAVAAGLYGIARKVASVPLIVRQTFLYVLAPVSSAEAGIDRARIAPLYRFANRIAAIIVPPLTALMIVSGEVILIAFSPAAAAALPILIVLLVGRAGEALFGAATPIIEMLGHRALPLLNSMIGLGVWAGLALWLVPDQGGVGMGVAVAAGVIAASLAAVIELAISDRLSPVDRHVLAALVIGGVAASALTSLPILFPAIGSGAHAALAALLFWPLVWLGLRFGLDAADKAALGRLSRVLRL